MVFTTLIGLPEIASLVNQTIIIIIKAYIDKLHSYRRISKRVRSISIHVNVLLSVVLWQ